MWSSKTIKLILQNELYIGHTIAFKRKTRSYRDDRTIKRDKSEWIRAENTHEPIIHKKLWDKVQQINKISKDKHLGTKQQPKPTLFSGFITCHGCKTKMGLFFKSYGCRTYHKSGKASCSPHYIPEKHLKNLVLYHINNTAKQITLNEEEIFKKLQCNLLHQCKTNKQDARKKRRQLEKQLHILELETEQLFEDKLQGKINQQDFLVKITKNDTLHQETKTLLQNIDQATKKTSSKLEGVDKWVRLIKQKSDVVEVDRGLLEGLVEKIEVEEKILVDGAPSQKVRIYFKFVGL